MYRTAILAAAAAVSLSFSAHAASECKGLSESACGSNSKCTWRQAVKTGDMQKNGKAAARDTKAHCRLQTKSVAAK